MDYALLMEYKPARHDGNIMSLNDVLKLSYGSAIRPDPRISFGWLAHANCQKSELGLFRVNFLEGIGQTVEERFRDNGVPNEEDIVWLENWIQDLNRPERFAKWCKPMLKKEYQDKDYKPYIKVVRYKFDTLENMLNSCFKEVMLPSRWG